MNDKLEPREGKQKKNFTRKQLEDEFQKIRSSVVEMEKMNVELSQAVQNTNFLIQKIKQMEEQLGYINAQFMVAMKVLDEKGFTKEDYEKRFVEERNKAMEQMQKNQKPPEEEKPEIIV